MNNKAKLGFDHGTTIPINRVTSVISSNSSITESEIWDGGEEGDPHDGLDKSSSTMSMDIQDTNSATVMQDTFCHWRQLLRFRQKGIGLIEEKRKAASGDSTPSIPYVPTMDEWREGDDMGEMTHHLGDGSMCKRRSRRNAVSYSSNFRLDWLDWMKHELAAVNDQVIIQAPDDGDVNNNCDGHKDNNNNNNNTNTNNNDNKNNNHNNNNNNINDSNIKEYGCTGQNYDYKNSNNKENICKKESDGVNIVRSVDSEEEKGKEEVVEGSDTIETTEIMRSFVERKLHKRSKTMNVTSREANVPPEERDVIESLDIELQWLIGILKFNRNPIKGIKWLRLHNLLGYSSKELAEFFMREDGLSKTMIGEYLGRPESDSQQIMKEMAGRMCFKEIPFVCAVRLFLSYFRLPGEAQKIDRIMEVFAKRFYQDQPGLFRDVDTGYVLAFSVVMLNTDRHNPNILNKMSKEAFIRNNRGIDKGENLPEGFLSQVYDDVCAHEIITKDRRIERNLYIATLITSLPASVQVGRPHRKFIGKYHVEKMEYADKLRSSRQYKDIFLFNDTLVVTKPIKNGTLYKYFTHMSLYDVAVIVLPPVQPVQSRRASTDSRPEEINHCIIYNIFTNEHLHLCFNVKQNMSLLLETLGLYIELSRYAFDDKIEEKGMRVTQCPPPITVAESLECVPPQLMIYIPKNEIDMSKWCHFTPGNRDSIGSEGKKKPTVAINDSMQKLGSIITHTLSLTSKPTTPKFNKLLLNDNSLHFTQFGQSTSFDSGLNTPPSSFDTSQAEKSIADFKAAALAKLGSGNKLSISKNLMGSLPFSLHAKDSKQSPASYEELRDQVMLIKLQATEMIETGNGDNHSIYKDLLCKANQLIELDHSLVQVRPRISTKGSTGGPPWLRHDPRFSVLRRSSSTPGLLESNTTLQGNHSNRPMSQASASTSLGLGEKMLLNKIKFDRFIFGRTSSSPEASSHPKGESTTYQDLCAAVKEMKSNLSQLNVPEDPEPEPEKESQTPYF
eukprot:Ihof_evm1s322 gene=Ihof_evmTU1s322